MLLKRNKIVVAFYVRGRQFFYSNSMHFSFFYEVFFQLRKAFVSDLQHKTPYDSLYGHNLYV